MGATPETLTPLMRQYHTVKSQYPDKIVLFRMGDFYEMFGEDAIIGAPALGVALTSRNNGGDQKTALAGVPYHAIEKYLPRLLAAGHKVVIVEQVEDPKTAKGVVKREVVEILTPGSASIDALESPSRPSYLASVVADANQAGLAYLDITTGEFRLCDGSTDEIAQRLATIEPREILTIARDDLSGKTALSSPKDPLVRYVGSAATISPVEAALFRSENARRGLEKFFGLASLDGFGVADSPVAVRAAGAIISYLRDNHRDSLSHITRLVVDSQADTMWLDYNSSRNLELAQSLTDPSGPNLFDSVNVTRTPGGARRLRRNILAPFRHFDPIIRRQEAVTEALGARITIHEILPLLARLPDLERLAGKIGIRRVGPRQILALVEGLSLVANISQRLSSFQSTHLRATIDAIPDLSAFATSISARLSESPPHLANQGGIFRAGASAELDQLRESIREAKEFIAGLQDSERRATGISTLKVGFNKVFGYYIEITHARKEKIPERYLRRQTLVNAERYITEEMKERETLIFAAEEKINALEQQIFAAMVEEIADRISDIQLVADCVAEIDVVVALAELAAERNYTRPTITTGVELDILEGRHPVIERLLPKGEFVPNNVSLGQPDCSFVILTGPNMAGKSTYLRQIGHIVILAQIGSFVPAEKATIGLVDRVFTRVGAVDKLALGQSTFMVEMLETANILNNATGHSLVLLDEIGRGTSTFDGLSLAWAVVEELSSRPGIRAVFATHYHELTTLATNIPCVVNFQVAVRRWEDKVIFLHKIIPGGCDDSYGIEVAKLAGLPKSVVSRAREILQDLEMGKSLSAPSGSKNERIQISLFDSPPSAIESEIRTLDIDTLSGLTALQLLSRWKKDLA